MPRRSLEHIRREQLSRAAFETLAEHGLKGTSLLRVAEKADLSKSVVLHYFKTKEALMEAAVRQSNTVTRQEVVGLLRHARTPWERLYAVIEGNFSDKVFRPSLCHAWLALCAEVPYNRQYQRLQTVIHRRMLSNLLPPLRQLAPAADQAQIAFAIRSMIDGIWLAAGLQIGGLDRNAALAHMDFQFDRLIPTTEAQRAEKTAARERIRSVYDIRSTAA